MMLNLGLSPGGKFFVQFDGTLSTTADSDATIVAGKALSATKSLLENKQWFIKISGTTVIDNSRNGTNLGIVTATSFVGDGSGLTNLPPSGGTMTATASGSISNGAPVIIQNDGKVKSVAGCALTTGQNDIEIFESGDSNGNIASVYDSGNKKIVTFIKTVMIVQN